VISDGAENTLLRRVLNAFLREDVVGLRSRSHLVRRPDGLWLRLGSSRCSAVHGALLLPVAEDGFQCEYAARLSCLERTPGGGRVTSLDAVIVALRELAEPEDRAGFDAFAEEIFTRTDAGLAGRSSGAGASGCSPGRWEIVA